MKRFFAPFFIIVVALMLGMALLFSGCTHVPDLKPGQAVIRETQVEGIDISIPIPFVENVAILNLRFGFIQNKLYKGYNVPYISRSNYSNISLLKGQGTIARLLMVGADAETLDNSNNIFSIGIQK